MGRKRRRKHSRQQEQRQANSQAQPAWHADIEPTDEELLAILWEQEGHRVPQDEQKRCGQCKEFVEDELTSRGACLHPGSGIVSPWTDTPGCDFYTGRRRRIASDMRF